MPTPVNGIALICAWTPCGKPFLAFPSAVKRHKVNYCSRPCADLGNAVARTKRVTLTCDWPPCGKTFESHAYRLHRGSKIRCCSRICRAKLVAQNRFPGTLEDKFWAQVDRREPDECWPWQGRLRGPGRYGMLYVPDTQQDTGTHIIAFYIAHGRWPLPGMYICHSCDNPPCCNAHHLWEGTALDNAQDSARKGRKPSGERHHNSKLTDAQWQEILALLAENVLTKRQIAATFHITTETIHTRIRKGNN